MLLLVFGPLAFFFGGPSRDTKLSVCLAMTRVFDGVSKTDAEDADESEDSSRLTMITGALV